MAPSQLKQLKASLRDSGVLGPQKSKKVRKANAKDGARRSQRNAALEGIRERFNPFEAKAPARRDKFEVATNKPTKTAIGRPGVTRGLGEERRRETLLKEMQSRNKVGGLLDRRFGENDPTMTPEERAAERFARQALRTSKKNSMFNLEDDSEEEMLLTHGGRSLELGDSLKDSYQEDDLSGLSDEDDIDDRPKKKQRFESGAENEEDHDSAGIPERRKTKNEVMKEIIAKSKMYKAERQAAKADDDDLRAELDKGMGDFFKALNVQGPPTKQLPSPPHTDSEPTMDPGRAAMLAGKSREDAEKEYETNLKQLQMDARSKPSVRTKTEDEKAAEAAAKLEDLERKRLRRMRGEAESSEDEEDEEEEEDVRQGDDKVEGEEDEFDDFDDAEAFGLAQPVYQPRPQLDVEDEDDFVLDDIIASDSEADMASREGTSEVDSDAEVDDDGDDDFINGLVLPKPVETVTKAANMVPASRNLAYTFQCPQTHTELLEITKSTKLTDLPTVVQRIRALYHKGLSSDNSEKIGRFADVLTQHIAYLANSDMQDLPYTVLESLLRHLHSIAKAQPEDVSLAFRNRLREMSEQRALSLRAGDLILLTGVSTIFPTSDHFHSVVTPSMLTLARFLGQSSVTSFQDLGLGAYACCLALQYQQLAQRFVPEVVNYIVSAIAILAPVPLPAQNSGNSRLNVSVRLPETPLRFVKSSSSSSTTTTKLAFDHLRTIYSHSLNPATLLKTFIVLAEQATQLWHSKAACPEFASAFLKVLEHLTHDSNRQHLPKDLRKLATETSITVSNLINVAVVERKPLLLHNHRPLAIKSSIPQFIENYNPDRHYDPDRERAEMSKLKAEHKKERKGAMRELRKDANFIAREQLREKKVKDAAYDKKFKRLIAEIQGEEGKEAKEYAREKAKRKGRF